MSRLTDLLRGGHGELVDESTGRPVSVEAADMLDIVEGELGLAKDYLGRIQRNTAAWHALDPADRTMIETFLK